MTDDGDDGFVSIILCVDDTDDETKSTSTGKVAELIASAVPSMGGRMRLGITRHQLLLREDVPYTSHNSSMCFEASLPSGRVDALRTHAIEVLARECVPTADPGLALAVFPRRSADAPDVSAAIDALIAFGQRAKVEYCSKRSAYDLAARIPWLSLSEHGGDGQGVVGALAGVGLRLSGADGRFRGTGDLTQLLAGSAMRGPRSKGEGDGSGGGRGRGDGSGGGRGRKSEHDASASVPALMTAQDVTVRLSTVLAGPVRVVDVDGSILPPDTPLITDVKIKALYQGASFTIACRLQEGIAYPLDKDALDGGAMASADDGQVMLCPHFELDNDPEERSDRSRCCRNCLHRRLEQQGFSCTLGAI
ncbi:MAG: hypothetical protein IJH83_01035 [Coriobacteriales bacterium]|nr:hypothetical protein [Coriobacteriales bacterium]